MRFIRTLSALGATTLLWAAGVSAGLVGCGGSPEVAKSPEPVKVVWGNGEPPAAADAPSTPEAAPPAPRETASAEPGGGPLEVDLDAVPPDAVPPEEKASTRKSAPAKEAEEPEEDSPEVSEPSAAVPLGKEMRAAVKSKEKKSSKPKKRAAKKSEPAEPPEPAAATYAGPNACKAARFSVARVGEACAKGGRTAAKGVMKDAISKALAAGTTLRCSDCHTEQRDYTLKPDAVAQLKTWLDR